MHTNVVIFPSSFPDMWHIHSGRFDDSLASGDHLDETTRGNIRQVAMDVARKQPTARVFLIEVGNLGFNHTCREMLRQLQAAYNRPSLAGFGFVVGPNCATGLNHLTDTIGVGAISISDGLNTWQVQMGLYCTDAVRTIVRALDNALLNPNIPRLSNLTIARSTKAQRNEFMREIRDVQVLEAESGSGRVRFNNDDNNRDPKTLSFVMSNTVPRVALPTSTGAAAAGGNASGTASSGSSSGSGAVLTYAADMTNNRLNIRFGQVLVWPGNEPEAPLDRSRESIPTEVGMLVLDNRPRIIDWAKKAETEINAMASVLPFTKMTVEAVLIPSLSNRTHITMLVDAFLAAMHKKRARVVALEIRGTGNSERMHAYAMRNQTYLVMSPFAAGDSLSNVSSFPLFLRTGGSDGQYTSATFNMLKQFEFRRGTILLNKKSYWATGMANSLQKQASIDGLDLRIVHCDAESAATTVDWASIAAHSKILIHTLTSKAVADACVKAAAAWTVAETGTERYFQHVIPYAQWAFETYELADDPAMGRLLDGAIGPGSLVGISKASSRYEDFSTFWEVRQGEEGGGGYIGLEYCVCGGSARVLRRVCV